MRDFFLRALHRAFYAGSVDFLVQACEDCKLNPAETRCLESMRNHYRA